MADRALLDLASEMVVAENRAKAARLQAVSEFHARRVAEVEAHAAGASGPWDGIPGYFMLTPLQATKAEFGPLLGISELYLQLDLDLADDLQRWLPGVWRRCREGRLDLGRAQALREQLGKLASDRARAGYAEEVEAWVAKHDDPDAPFFRLPHTTVRRAARRISLRQPQRSPDESFADAFQKRRVTLNLGEDGVGSLSCVTAVHDLLGADHRLTLIARKRREVEGEQRTLAQLRADTLIDLVHGRLTVTAGDGELEDDCLAGSGCAEHEDGADEAGCADPAAAFDWSTVGQFARPVVNVTVPITTLMGLGEEGGVLSGGIPIPAELARRIADDPDSVWYRMLTDPDGGFVELSSDSYAPNGVIWRWTAARDVQCVHPGCCRPATVVELDHRVPWPQGKTSTWNIQPLCKKHHKVKHSLGYTVVREVDGSYTWTTRFGSVFRKPPPDHPLADVDERLLDLLLGRATSSDRDAPSIFDDDADVPWFDFCPDDREGEHWCEEWGEELEAAFREWFDRVVVATP
ncbi:MAG TPA: DUF222 domain-containing protein [Nocardioidaceae bacterium]|nr:DUF222 domain-containing protein [Nocardioidaceae bacterium]